MTNKNTFSFEDAIQGLTAGDFSRLAPLFDDSTGEPRSCQIIEWHQTGKFADEHKALDEAFICACFLGSASVAEYLLSQGIDPNAGDNTGLNGFHWAVNRGQFDCVKLLISHGLPLETRNTYGGTLLETAIWSAVNEPKAYHLHIIETLINSGARLDGIVIPTGNEQLDEILKPFIGASR